MNRLTSNDHTWGPFTAARWKSRFGITVSSGDDEDPENTLLMTGFGWALRVHLPTILKPVGKYGEHPQEFGFTLCDMGNGYDFLQVMFGPETGDSSTSKCWSKHLPWKQWSCVRNSVYEPDGTLFATEARGHKGAFFDFLAEKDKCPSSRFGFEDYDGEMIVATCVIEEREWHRGEGWFTWLRFFWPAKIRRSLDLKFSAEVGPQKGSWKGGTIGHGIDMEPGETPRAAFERYCAMEHDRKGRKFRLRFVGPVNEEEVTK